MNQAWFGPVPSGWHVRRMREAAVLTNGFPFPSEEFSKVTGKRVLRIRDLTANDDLTYFDGDWQQSSLVRDGDVLIGMDGDFNVCCWSGGEALLNQRVCRLRERQGFDLRFLYHLLPLPLKIINDLTYFTTVKHISSGQVLAIQFPVSDLGRQREIAAFLDRKTAAIDQLIQKKERLIELLQEKRQALITQAVTKGLDPNVRMKNSGAEWLGMIPTHWDVMRVKHVATLESGHTPDRAVREYWLDTNDIPWVSLNDTSQLSQCDYISDTALHVNALGIENSSARMLPARVVVFTRDATIGEAAITTRPMAVSQHIIAWVCGPRMIPEYLLRVFYAMKAELGRYTMGATLRTIGMTDVKRLVTTVPPVAEQERISEFLTTEVGRLDGIRVKIEGQIACLREYRQALISAAVTGQIDVTREAL